MEAFKKWAKDRSLDLSSSPSDWEWIFKYYMEAAKAIKSNPSLLWPEGEKWISDEEVDDRNDWDEFAPGEGDHFRVWKRGATEIRDKAQEQIDGFRSAYEYIHKCYDDMTVVYNEQQKRIEELEAMVREMREKLYPLAHIELTGVLGNIVYQRDKTFITVNNVYEAGIAIDQSQTLVP